MVPPLASALVAAATGRALLLLTVLDREHDPAEIHAAARAVRHELHSIAALVGEHRPPDLPGRAHDGGEQIPLL